MPGIDVLVCPDRAEVANAVGAAFAQIGGEIDRIFSLAGRTRADVLEEAREHAYRRAVDAGADPASVRVVDAEDVPLTHLPGGTALRVRVKTIGDLAGQSAELEGAHS